MLVGTCVVCGQTGLLLEPGEKWFVVAPHVHGGLRCAGDLQEPASTSKVEVSQELREKATWVLFDVLTAPWSGYSGAEAAELWAVIASGGVVRRSFPLDGALVKWGQDRQLGVAMIEALREEFFVSKDKRD